MSKISMELLRRNDLLTTELKRITDLVRTYNAGSGFEDQKIAICQDCDKVKILSHYDETWLCEWCIRTIKRNAYYDAQEAAREAAKETADGLTP